MLQFFFRRQTSNIFILFDFTFQENMAFLLIYWMPYYFTLNNFKDSSIYILIVFPVFTSVGSFVFNLMVNKCCPSYDSIATCILMVLSFCASLAMCFIGTDPQDVFLYLALVSAFLSLPYSKVCSTEISDRVQNAKENYIAVNGMRIFR
jgi:predicted MFS family arabinose efflux permease